MRRLAAIILFAAAFILGVSTEPWFEPPLSDVAADKYLALAAWDGTGPHLPLDQLGDRYGLEIPPNYDVPAARTPGGLLLASPLILIPDTWLSTVSHVVSVAALLAVCWMAARIGRLPEWAGGVFAVALAGSWLMTYQYTYGNAGIWVAVFIAAGWWLLPSRWAGVLLGAAVVLKVWPAMIVAVVLTRRELRSIGWWAVGSGLGLTVLGLILPGTSIAGTVESLTGGMAHAEYALNMSAVGMWGVPAVVGLLAGAVMAVVGLPLKKDWRLSAAVVGAVFASPIAWPVYWLAAAPVVAVMIRLLTDAVSRTSAPGDVPASA